MSFTALGSELQPVLAGLDFQEMPTETFLYTEGQCFPPTLHAYENRIAAGGLSVVSYLVKTNGCRDNQGRTMPNILTYGEYRPRYFFRADVYGGETVPSDPQAMEDERAASLRTVIGSDVFSKADEEPAYMLDEHWPYQPTLLANLIVYRHSNLWRTQEQECLKLHAEAAYYNPEFDTRDSVGRVVYDALGFAEESREAINFPTTVYLTANQFRQSLVRLLGIAG